jgi:hypothetical protein
LNLLFYDHADDEDDKTGTDDDVDDEDENCGSLSPDYSAKSSSIPLKQAVRLLNHVSNAIDELYRIGTLIRRPRLTGRYLHSANSDGIIYSTQQDYQHIREKLHLWQRQVAELKDDEFQIKEHLEDEEPVVTAEDIQRRETQERTTDELEFVLSRRLALANVKRRLQLRYWEAHPYNPEPDVAQDATPKPEAKRIVPKRLEEGHAQSLKPPETAHTFSMIARSAVLPEAGSTEVDMTRTVYESSVVGDRAQATIRVPDVPIGPVSEELFECPFCHMMLKSARMRNRLEWK